MQDNLLCFLKNPLQIYKLLIFLFTPNLQKLGFFNIEGARAEGFAPVENPLGAVMRLRELSKGKDTTTGHWELAGIVSREPMPVFPEGPRL